jgi:hypothetical protein
VCIGGNFAARFAGWQRFRSGQRGTYGPLTEKAADIVAKRSLLDR